MSGGVDSSVVAAMLHEAGESVVGVSMRLYATGASVGKSCCSPDDLYDAREVASAFGFPFYVANYQEAFQERVIDYFVDEYRRGRTPSPCILCNDHLKFDVLLERMVALGGAYLATGHYARIEERDGRWCLLRGVDNNKDQSYFLFGLRREALPLIRFPLGEITKAEVRDLAAQLGLETANKPESQDICFVAGRSYVEFVEERLKDDEIRPGRIVRASTGEVLGKHDGIHRYTVGQRRGLGVAHSEPLYVKRVDAETGDVIVGTASEVNERQFRVERCNWLRWETPPAAFTSGCQVRYRHSAVPATVRVDLSDPSRATVCLDDPDRGISPGQAAVFYDGGEVLGGGWIEEVG
jgi:tRNA-specific 2-thiouridylase